MAAKALDLEQKAQKKEKSFWGGQGKFEEAAEMYMKAANFYKLDKLWMEAGRAYERAAACLSHESSHSDVVNAFVEASMAYKKASAGDALRCLEAALALEMEDGHLASAARLEKATAELCEAENNWDGAITHYQHSADILKGENQPSAASASLIKVAHISGLNKEDHNRAADIYEQLAFASLDNNLTHWSARDYYQRAGICRMCMGDIAVARRAMEGYIEQDATFGATRECKLLNDILAAWEQHDVEAFTMLCSNMIRSASWTLGRRRYCCGSRSWWRPVVTCRTGVSVVV